MPTNRPANLAPVAINAGVHWSEAVRQSAAKAE